MTTQKYRFTGRSEC